MREVHRVQVYRTTESTVDRKTVKTTAQVYASLPCLVESLPERDKETVLGRLPLARYRITWSNGTLKNDDMVKFDGSWYRAREIEGTTGLGSRRVQQHTAVLEQDHRTEDPS